MKESHQLDEHAEIGEAISQIPIVRARHGAELAVPLPVGLSAGPLVIKLITPMGATALTLELAPCDHLGTQAQVSFGRGRKRGCFTLDGLDLT